VRVAYSALLEVAASLQAYRESMVLIGGWVPYLLLQGHQGKDSVFRHVGSIDSDWVVDPDKVGSREYETIVGALKKRGFREDVNMRYRLVKDARVPDGPEPLEIAVDLLTAVPPRGRGSSRRHREIQPDLPARVTPGAEVALAHFATLELEGELLTGGRLELPVQVADVVGSIGTKGLALGRRFEEKDNYDIYALIANYGDGPAEVASAVKPFLGEPTLRSSLAKIREWFRGVDAAGPIAVADFFPNVAGGARDRLVRTAFENVDRFLIELGLT
jgi:hypothetical protein